VLYFCNTNGPTLAILLFAGAGILKTPLGERLRAEREILEMSRCLVSLKLDVRLGVTWNMLAYESH